MLMRLKKGGCAMNKMINCKTCGAEIAASAKSCPSCGAKNKPPIYKRVWFWLVIVFVVIPIIGGIAGGGGDSTNSSNNSNETVSSSSNTISSNSNTASSNSNNVVSAKNSNFDGDCGIAASAEMGSSIIGLPELTISVTNTTDKDISAIQFYAIPCDVYGDEITGWTSQNKIYTDTSIGAGKSDTMSFQFIEDSVKTLKLYVYSVYFADGTEWGDKDATKSTILSNGALIEVSGQS